MDYILLSLIPKKAFSILEFERAKKLINRLLEIEFVDNKSIYWDENGDLLFHPPINKKDRSYWVNVLNTQIDKDNWELISGKVH
jgi:hypothetical protein